MLYLKIIIMLFFHALDMLFTVLILEKTGKDGWELEVNYHRYFFKKFGYRKGAALSFPISASVLTTLVIIADRIMEDPQLTQGVMIGICMMLAYSNMVCFFSFDDMQKRRKNNLRKIVCDDCMKKVEKESYF